jgi:hypothetical protein
MFFRHAQAARAKSGKSFGGDEIRMRNRMRNRADDVEQTCADAQHQKQRHRQQRF